MLNLNRVEVIGNLTRDPELRYTPNGQAVASFAIATNRRYRDQAGNWIDSPPEYHEVVVWGKLGEGVNHVLKKGVRVYATGRLQTRSWEAPDGAKRYKTELIADTIIGPDQVSKAAYSGEFTGATVQQSSSFSQSPPPTTDLNTFAAESPQVTQPSQTTPSPSGTSPAAPTTTEDEINIEDIPF